MTLKFKTQVVKLGLGLFHVFRYLWKSFSFLLIFGFWRPLEWLGQSVILRLLVTLYRPYHRLKQRFGTAALRTSWLYPFTTRYLIHVIVVLMTFTVAANSVFAREPKVEEFGSKTLLSAFFQEDTSETEFVEFALATPKAGLSTVVSDGTINRYHRTDVSADTERDMLAIVRQESNGEVVGKAENPLTGLSGTPRSNVEEYVVQGGDTLSTIAEAYLVSSDTLRWANGLDDRAMIKPGQTLKIPPVSGVLHTIASGETVSSIAKKFQADENAILEFNQLADASAIEVGSQLVIPGGKIEAPKPAPVVSSGSSGTVDNGGPRPANARVVGSGLLWPAPGHKINQGYSYRHTGIDIDTDHSPIYAALGGRVVRTNWGRGYGNNIVIDHGNGLQTLYAHLSKGYVSTGDTIDKGETIGISGCTGWCTGDHLHFEVWSGGRRTNPFNYF